MSHADYVLITAAKNEEEYIERTLASVVAQTVLPRRWVIVSDGSTDRTDEIVSSYAERYPFISLLRRESGQHCFGSMVHSALAALDELRDEPYDFFGNLDADIELPCDYYEQLLDRFADDDQLGLVGGTRSDLINGQFVPIKFNELSIGGAYQFFRRACYEDIGGFIPLDLGGVDTVAGIMARERGWGVKTFADIEVRHYRPTGIARGNIIRAGYKTGKMRYLVGYHPIFEFARSLRIESPKGMVHKICEIAGFTVAALQGHKRQVSDEMVTFLRAEQMARLKQMLLKFHDPATGKQSHLQRTDRRSMSKF